MLPPVSYLAWARRFYGQVDHDLARSGVPDFAAAELARLAPEAFASPDDPSWSARFREAIAERWGVPAAEVVPALGASGALWVAYATLLSPGDEALVETPSYEPMVVVPEGLGARVRRFERPAARGFAVDVDAVVAALGPRTRVVALSNPHNPSGVALDDEALAPLARALEARGVWLLVDEVYRELAAPRATARRLGRHVAVVSSLTKCFGLGWARAGWAVLPAELGDAAMDATTHATGALPPSQAAFGAAGLAHLGALEAARDRAQAGKRALLDAFVEQHARVLSWTAPPPGSVFGFLLDRRGEDLRPRIEAGVASERTIAAPGSFFGHPAGVRIALASPLPRIREGLDRLARVLDLA